MPMPKRRNKQIPLPGPRIITTGLPLHDLLSLRKERMLFISKCQIPLSIDSQLTRCLATNSTK